MEVQKVGAIGHKAFMEQFYNPGIPVVFKNASSAWQASTLFTPDYFRKNFGDRRTTVNGKEYTMMEILALIEESSSEHPAPYPSKFDIPFQLPELMPLISPLSMGYALPNWFESKILPLKIRGSSTELFLGGPGGKFPVAHIDLFHTNAWITQLYGDKNFIVFPRGQDEFMYPRTDNKYLSDVNIFDPDYQKHPLYRKATPITVKVKQGETMFVPFGMWHSAESLTPSISVIFDQINAKNFDFWVQDVLDDNADAGTLKKMAIKAYAAATKTYCMAGDMIGIKRNRYKKPLKH